jgi:hypothetical protein
VNRVASLLEDSAYLQRKQRISFIDLIAKIREYFIFVKLLQTLIGPLIIQCQHFQLLKTSMPLDMWFGTSGGTV